MTYTEPGFSSLMVLCSGAVQVTKRSERLARELCHGPSTVNFPGRTNPGWHRQAQLMGSDSSVI